MNIIKKLCQFRIATLNIHFFMDSQGKSNVHHLIQLLKPMSLDILAVQEASHIDQPSDQTPKKFLNLKLLSDSLELPHIAFGFTTPNFGNGILSKYPIEQSLAYRTEKIDDHHTRGMLAVQINNEFFNDNNATLYVTHLDQISEQIRLKQLDYFEKNIRHKSNDFQLIMGDFNALTFDDYSQDYFNKNIRDVRQRSSWEKPFNLVTNKMKEYGYLDCWRNMNKQTMDEQAMTCVYRTRIDYIWRRGDLKNGWQIDECQIFSTENATDHNGVVITFSKNS